MKTAEISGKPALPCPSWCTRDHGQEIGAATHHRRIRRIGGDLDSGWVGLIQADFGCELSDMDVNGLVAIQVRGPLGPIAACDLEDAGEFADLAATLGNTRVSVLIRELAELARQ